MKPIFILMTGKGPMGKTTEIFPVRFYDNEKAAMEHLEYMRKITASKKSADCHVTTRGKNYFTFKYEWPIKGAELRHTYWVEGHPCYSTTSGNEN